MKEYVGKMVLYRVGCGTLAEGSITAVSPNGAYVKISGRWLEVDRVNIVDILRDLDICERMMSQ